MPAPSPAPVLGTPPPIRTFTRLNPFRAGPHAHDPHDVTRLALSENPLGASPEALAAAHAEIDRANWYPHSDGEPLRRLLADRYHLDSEQVIVGNGADEMILLAALATLGTARPAVTTARTFAGYAAAFEIAGRPYHEVPLAADADGGGVDVAAVCRAAASAGCVLICNPHNPTGTCLTTPQVQLLVDACRSAGAVLILDEAYAEYADPAAFGSGLAHLKQPGVVVVRTFSKAYGLAGLRCGYALGDPTAIAAMTAMRTALPYNTNRVALAAAAAALADASHLAAVVADCASARDDLTRRLTTLGIETRTSQTNFVLARLGEHSAAVIARLADEHGIHIRDTTGLGLPGWARISVPAAADVPRLADALGQILPTPHAAPRFLEARP